MYSMITFCLFNFYSDIAHMLQVIQRCIIIAPNPRATTPIINLNIKGNCSPSENKYFFN